MSSSEMTRELEEMTVGTTAVWVREKLLALSKRLDATEARLGEAGKAEDPFEKAPHCVECRCGYGQPHTEGCSHSAAKPPPADGAEEMAAQVLAGLAAEQRAHNYVRLSSTNEGWLKTLIASALTSHAAAKTKALREELEKTKTMYVAECAGTHSQLEEIQHLRTRAEKAEGEVAEIQRKRGTAASPSALVATWDELWQANERLRGQLASRERRVEELERDLDRIHQAAIKGGLNNAYMGNLTDRIVTRLGIEQPSPAPQPDGPRPPDSGPWTDHGPVEEAATQWAKKMTTENTNRTTDKAWAALSVKEIRCALLDFRHIYPPSPAPTGEIERVVRGWVSSLSPSHQSSLTQDLRHFAAFVLSHPGTASRWRDAEREKPTPAPAHHLVYVERIGHCTAQWNAFGDTIRGWQVEGFAGIPPERVTHWMPLPNPPASGRSAG